MTSAELLEGADRCARIPYLSRSWQRNTMSPMGALYRSIEAGLESSDPDPGQCAGDTLMGLAVDRGLETPQSDLFGLAQHLAAIADLVTWILRPEGPWERPENVKVGSAVWESSAFLNGSGTRLRRILLVDHWNEARELAESHSWRAFGECAAYGMPMDQTVIVLGANRSGRRHGAFSKAWQHPVSKQIRFRKRDGSGFDGNWSPIYREDWEGSREGWLDAMTGDGVLEDSVLTTVVEIPVEVAQVRLIAQAKLAAIRETATLPYPSLSQCDSPLGPCQFREACWTFQPPSEQLGFVRVA
jgi:hypothetical protein